MFPVCGEDTATTTTSTPVLVLVVVLVDPLPPILKSFSKTSKIVRTPVPPSTHRKIERSTYGCNSSILALRGHSSTEHVLDIIRNFFFGFYESFILFTKSAIFSCDSVFFFVHFRAS